MEAGSSSSSGKNDEASMMNKVMSLIELASQQFKHEREELWKERSEFWTIFFLNNTWFIARVLHFQTF